MATHFRTNGQIREAVQPRWGLRDLQRAVGGYIEFLTLPDGSGFCVNEEGKLHNLPENKAATAILRLKWPQNGDVLVGDVLFFSRSEMEAME
jgi:hypothetical protein